MREKKLKLRNTAEREIFFTKPTDNNNEKFIQK